MTPPAPTVLARRALRIVQSPDSPLYLFSLTAQEILQIADISRVSRDQSGDLIGYQRPEVRQHVQEIVDYVDSDHVIFPNPIIIALPSTVRFACTRGPNSTDDATSSVGTLKIPLPTHGSGAKPGWIVDGQQRALALARARRQDLPIPVNAFVADSIEIQRDQFLRINNTKPLPRGLVAELLPTISSPLPSRLALRKTPSALCDLLNNNAESPFFQLIRRSSSKGAGPIRPVIADTSVINMLQESLISPAGALFPFRNMSSGETDFAGLWQALLLYWTVVKKTFPEAWGKPPSDSRLMHGAGIRTMGRLMDRIMSTIDPHHDRAADLVAADLDLVAASCRWTSGRWDSVNLRWNEIQNVPRHINELSSYLVRTYVAAKAAQR